MESKLLCGGKNIIDHTNEQQRALQLRTQELLEQKACIIRNLRMSNITFEYEEGNLIEWVFNYKCYVTASVGQRPKEAVAECCQ